jgi:hypothetical protein
MAASLPRPVAVCQAERECGIVQAETTGHAPRAKDDDDRRRRALES